MMIEQLVFETHPLDHGQDQNGFLPALGGFEPAYGIGVLVPQGHEGCFVISPQLSGQFQENLFHDRSLPTVSVRAWHGQLVPNRIVLGFQMQFAEQRRLC